MSLVSKEDAWGCLACFLLLAVGTGFYALMPDREISEDRYVEIAQAVRLCPDAQSALDALNKDHKILGSEANKLEDIIKGYIKQDERSWKAHSVAVAKGIQKGPPRIRTCLPLPEEPKKK